MKISKPAEGEGSPKDYISHGKSCSFQYFLLLLPSEKEK